MTQAGSTPLRSAVVAAGLLVGQQVAAKATRDALFLSQFDVTALPLISIVAAAVSFLAVLGFARGMVILTPGGFMPLALGAGSLLLVFEWVLSRFMPRAAAVAVFLHTAVFGATLVSGFWSLVNECFDPYSAKRAIGAIGAGASLGGVLGGLLTWAAAAVVSVPSMLLVLAGLNLLALPPLLELRPSGRPSGATPEEPRAALSGLRLIRQVPYLRSLAVVVILGAFLEAFLDYVFSAAAAARYVRGGPLMSFFARFHTGVGLLALLVQAAFARAALGRLGLAGTMAIQPSSVAALSMLALLAPQLLAIVALRGAHGVLRNSLFRSAYELLYTPLPQRSKRETKAILDVGCDRLGTACGGAVVMLILAVTSQPTPVLLVLVMLSAGLILGLMPAFRSGYVAALAESLRTGAVTLDSASVLDSTTLAAVASVDRSRRETTGPAPQAGPQPLANPDFADPLLRAVAALRAGEPARIRGLLRSEERLDPALVPIVVSLLGRDDLFEDVVSSLRRVASACTGQLVDALLDAAQDPVVRRRIPRVLKAVPTQRAADGLLLGLKEDRLDVRYRCAQALARIKHANRALEIPRDEILQAAVREITLSRQSGRALEHVFSILSLVLEREPLAIALRALRSDDTVLRGTALEYLDNVLPLSVREPLWPWLGTVEKPSPSGRTTEQMRDDLLRSTASVAMLRRSQRMPV